MGGLGLLLLAACASPAAPAGTPTAVPATAPPPTATAVLATPAPLEATLQAAGVIETRVVDPTATPGRVSGAIDDAVTRAGLQDVTFLGLSSSDWANLGVSLLFVLGGYLLGTWLARLVRRRIAPLLESESAVADLTSGGNLLRWLTTLLATNIAVQRLSFLSAETKEVLELAASLAAVGLLARAAWLLLDIADAEMRARLPDRAREQELDPALVLLKRLGRVLVILLVMAAMLSLFGINVAAFAALLGIGGLAFSLAARSTIEDGIAGAIILLDRPFRVGDRIEVAAANTWGDVMEIGLRTTRVRTRDNRLVIIPNSVIVGNEIINYTYPDPTYRIQTEVSIDYAMDIDEVKRVLETAVRAVPGVLADRPVDVLYHEMGDSAMIFRVRWWVGTYADTRRVTDKIHTAIQHALDAAGIVSPYPTQMLLMQSLSLEGEAEESQASGGTYE
jgi:small-conductance mechanosensitive channel